MGPGLQTLRGDEKLRDTRNPAMGVQRSPPQPLHSRGKSQGLRLHPTARSRLSQTQSRPASQHLGGGGVLSIHVPVRLKREPESQVQGHTHGLEPSLLPWRLGSEPPRTGFQRPKPQRGCHKQRGSLYSKTSSGVSLEMCTWLPVEDRKQQIRAGQTAQLSSYCCVGTFPGRESQGK